MAGKKKRKHTAPTGTAGKARGVVAQLFTRMPTNEVQLRQRLRGVDRVIAVDALLQRLEHGALEPGQSQMATAALRLLGGETETARLTAVLHNGKVALARALALQVLDDTIGPQAAHQLLAQVPEAEQAEILMAPAAELLTGLQEHPEQASAVADLLEQHPADREHLLGLLGHYRRQVGTPATVAYAAALERATLADLHPMIIEGIVAEGGPAGLALLESLEQRQPTPEIRKAVLQLRTRSIEPDQRTAPAGEALLGTCDGQGAFILVALLRNPDGGRSMVNLCIRAGADVREAMVVARETRKGLREHLELVRNAAMCDFVPIELGLAAALAQEAVHRTREEMGEPLPPEAHGALALLGRVPAVELPALPSPAATVTLDTVDDVLLERIYSAWFLDVGDLNEAGVSPPSVEGEVGEDAWRMNAARQVAAVPRLRRRLETMARHMALWYLLGAKHNLARMMVALAEGVADEGTAADSPLVHALLLRSLDAVPEQARALSEIDVVKAIGDPDCREALRAELFPVLSDPRGRDLALLDLTEAAESAVAQFGASLPGHRRPRSGETVPLAASMARAFLDATGRRESDPGALVQGMAAAAAEVSRLDGEERETLAQVAVGALVTFVNAICDGCPVRCLDRPQARMKRAFFTDRHPANG